MNLIAVTKLLPDEQRDAISVLREFKKQIHADKRLDADKYEKLDRMVRMYTAAALHVIAQLYYTTHEPTILDERRLTRRGAGSSKSLKRISGINSSSGANLHHGARQACFDPDQKTFRERLDKHPDSNTTEHDLNGTLYWIGVESISATELTRMPFTLDREMHGPRDQG